jgi:hypothetical protein
MPQSKSKLFDRMKDIIIPFKKSRNSTESSPVDAGENGGSAGPDTVGDNLLLANIGN